MVHAHEWTLGKVKCMVGLVLAIPRSQLPHQFRDIAISMAR